MYPMDSVGELVKFRSWSGSDDSNVPGATFGEQKAPGDLCFENRQASLPGCGIQVGYCGIMLWEEHYKWI